MRLTNLTSRQAAEYFRQNDMVILSVGSVENHGSHNVLGVDTLIPEKLLTMIEERSDVLIAPGCPYGACDDLTGFAGTVSVGEECLYQFLGRIAEGLFRHGARKILFLNGHGGNTSSITRVCLDLEGMGGLGVMLNWWQLAGELNPAWKGGHGGGEETAAMMAVNPGLVDFTELKPMSLVDDLGPRFPTAGFDKVWFRGVGIPIPRRVERYTENGWIGPDDPGEATEEWGRQMLGATADYIVAFIEEFKSAVSFWK